MSQTDTIPIHVNTAETLRAAQLAYDLAERRRRRRERVVQELLDLVDRVETLENQVRDLQIKEVAREIVED